MAQQYYHCASVFRDYTLVAPEEHGGTGVADRFRIAPGTSNAYCQDPANPWVPGYEIWSWSQRRPAYKTLS